MSQTIRRLKILVFEDEQSIADALLYAFKTEGFQAVRASTAEEGLRWFAKEKFDLIVLDVGLPDASGFEVCKRIRKESQIPIFFLTARSEEVDKIVGLEIGADDYITKPFSPREVTARIKSLFRRLDSNQSEVETKKQQGAFAIDEAKFQISYKGKKLELTRYEFGLLRTLLKHPGRVYSRAQLMEAVWQEPDMSLERTVDTHVKLLRSKLKEVEPEKDLVVTHRGIGYSLAEDI